MAEGRQLRGGRLRGGKLRGGELRGGRLRGGTLRGGSTSSSVEQVKAGDHGPSPLLFLARARSL